MISFKNFSYTYKSQKKPTLKNINLEIANGEKVLIVGASGSGKSTLGSCINGLIPHSLGGRIEGDCTIDGLNLVSSSIYEISKRVGTVLQDSDAQFVGLTVAEDIAFTLENQEIPQKKMRETVSRMASVVSMEDFLDRSPQAISGGQKQRVSLAGVLVDDVDILLFDEPLANLDPRTGEQAIELIDQIHTDTNKTIIIIEHRLEDVLSRPVDRIILIDDGGILLDSTPRKLLASGLLVSNGIREPLYLAALRKAGCDLSGQDLSNLDSIAVDTFSDKLGLWARMNGRIPQVPQGKDILKVENLCYSYDGKRKALEDISFCVKEGEMLSVLGKNGAGKSTLAKVIIGICPPDSGKLIIDGVDGFGDTIASRSMSVGYVMQDPNHMISHNLIYDEIAFGLRERGLPEEQIRPRVEAVLQLCGLGKYHKWPISALSYGQKKRVTIASILVMQPKILILDEPTAGQDYLHYRAIMEFLKGLNKKIGITILFVTHDMHLALEYTPRAIVLADGKLLDDAPIANIFANEELLIKANLKRTSLFTLAKKAGIENIGGFIEGFIQSERQERDCETTGSSSDFERIPQLKLGGRKKSRRRLKREASDDRSGFGPGLSYIEKDSWIHHLTGVSKFVFFLGWIVLCLTTFDTRLLLVAFAVSLIALWQTRIPFSHFRGFFNLIMVLVTMNTLFIYLFSPGQGSVYMGTRTVILGNAEAFYALTRETLWYLIVIWLKYMTIFPIALIFVVATNPSEFASSLNRLKVSYNVSYSVALALRYLPEVTGDYTHISEAQQSRGVDISKNAPLKTRIVNMGRILSPLVLSSLGRVEVVTNAMTLRGFGRGKRRTWYNASKLKGPDFAVIGIILVFLVVSFVSRFCFKRMFFYPFS